MNTKVEIGPKCIHKDCKQEFNFSNFQLAVYLYGVFFLVKKSTPEEKGGKSYIGFTCPKCLRTNIHAHSYNDILKIKSELSTKMIEIFKSEKNDNGEEQNILTSSFLPDLKYYSPFMLNSEHFDRLNIKHYGCSTFLQDEHISNVISNHIDEKRPELKDKFCSFVGDSKAPADMFSVIYWYNEKDIESCLYFENKHNVRMFPRYYFYTDLVEKIDSLLRYNYFMGKPFEQAKEDHTIERTKDLEMLKAYASENNINYENIIKGNALNEPEALIKIIEENRKQIAKDSEFSAKFLNMLVSDPLPLGGSISKRHCDYLWISEDPFYKNELPDIFIDVIGDDELQLSVEHRLGEHLEMADRVLENRTKQYVQAFLEQNLVDFLEEYEELMRSEKFSYADICKLKESYLKGLYHETNKGLRNDKPFIFHYSGPGWTIRFNNSSILGLKDKGLKCVYFLLCNPNKSYSYFELDNIDGIDPNQCYQKIPRKFSQKKSGGTTKLKGKKTFDVKEIMDGQGFALFKEEKRKLEQALSEAKENNDIPMIEAAKQELDEFISYLREYYIPGKKNKKRSFSVREAKRIYERVEKRISRAIKNIESHNPELYLHFVQSFYGLSNKFYKKAGLKKLSIENHMMYKPKPYIDWHLD